MTAAMLLKLVPGQALTHSPTGNKATVLAAAAPSRTYGWRVQARSTTGVCWLTPANIEDWRLTSH